MVLNIHYSPFTFAQVKGSFHPEGSQPINLINADELEYSELGGIKLRKLTGNVQLQQNDVTLFCDQANQYLDQNLIDATGNVRIRQSDTINIYGNTLHYDGNSRKANLKGNVKLTDSHVILTTEELDYDLNTRVANYVSGGKMINDSAVLTSKHGYYYANSSDIFFKKDVNLVDPDYALTTDSLRFNSQTKIAYFVSPTYIHSDSFDVYCERGYFNTQSDIAQFEKNAVLKKPPQTLNADTIYFERLNGFGIARSRIRWADTSSKIFLQGNYAQFSRQYDRVLATKNALLITVIENDSLFLSGDTLLSLKDSIGNFRRLFAFHHVKLFKSDMQGICDSVAFSFRDSTFRLFHKPVLWVENNQMKADTINVMLKNKKIDKMNLLQNAFASNLADSGMYNQARGKNMFGYFKNSELERMEIIGNGESIYYAKDDNGGLIGVNKAVCSNMILYFDTAKKIDRIYFITQPDATLYPISSFPKEESRLKNFVWLDALRPKSKEDLFK
ncbi:MAG TPA: OstA-like protein [Chitinophagales bacterium]|nr:OstA-like protein [Chitinophagales bacterium]